MHTGCAGSHKRLLLGVFQRCERTVYLFCYVSIRRGEWSGEVEETRRDRVAEPRCTCSHMRRVFARSRVERARASLSYLTLPGVAPAQHTVSNISHSRQCHPRSVRGSFICYTYQANRTLATPAQTSRRRRFGSKQHLHTGHPLFCASSQE